MSRWAPAAGDCPKLCTDSIELHSWKPEPARAQTLHRSGLIQIAQPLAQVGSRALLTCLGPDAVLQGAYSNRPTACAGWLTGVTNLLGPRRSIARGLFKSPNLALVGSRALLTCLALEDALNPRTGVLPVVRRIDLVRPEGFEPSTLGSEDRCAIQLRHGRITEPSLADAVKILKGGNRQLEKP